VRPRSAAIVRIGRERTDEQIAFGYVLESLDRLPSVFLRLRFLLALRDVYDDSPPAGRAERLLRLFTDVDAAHAEVQALGQATGLARTVTVVRA